MIKITHFKTEGWHTAIRAARNPMESWNKSDSKFSSANVFKLGENDKNLLFKLRKAGPDHGKWTRQVYVSMDITAPLYFFKEFDTYKVGTVSNSTSTMHLLGKRLLTLNDFSFDNQVMGKQIVNFVNNRIYEWQRTGSKSGTPEWRDMIQCLPDSFNQTRTWTGSIENLINMYFQRRNHKLQEWKDFCLMLERKDKIKELLDYLKD